MRTLASLLRISLLVVLFTASFWAYATMAQMETGTISGLITDETGAAVPGAQLQLLNVQRGTTADGKTNSAGIYVFNGVQPGLYQIKVQKPGFKQVDLLSLVVNVQDHIEQNVRLQVGSVSESVTVNADEAHINTTDATVKTVVDRQFVKELPLNGRSFQTLFQLTPGVVITSTSYVEQGQFSINGQRADANYVTVDGVSANVGMAAGLSAGQSASGALPALTAGGGTNGLVSVDALQEFTIQTSGYAPEFGRTPGGQVSILTRSGTNQFHGTAFDYFRNGVLDANDWFADNKGLPKAVVKQNDFGGVFGGPILQNRTFIFFSYEGLRLRQPTTTLSDVPDLATRQSALPSTAALLNAYPLPNGPSEGGGLAPADYTYSIPARIDSESLRIDHHLRQNVVAFARYNRSTSDALSRATSGLALNNVAHLAYKLHTATAGLIWAITPTVANDLRFNWSWSRAATYFTLDNFGGATPFSLQSMLPGAVDLNDDRFFEQTNGTNISLLVGPNAKNLQQQLNLVDTLSWQARTHLFKFGVDYRRLSPQLDLYHYQQEANFNTVADMAAGDPTLGVNVGANFDPVNLRYGNYSLFGQDTWRATRRLSLTYGLRWDYNPAPSITGPNGLTALTIVGIDNFPNLAPARPGTPLYHATVDNFAPRLGVTYDLGNDKHTTVVRAGFGEFYDLGTDATGQIATFSPFSDTNFLHPTTFPITPAQAIPPTASLNPPYTQLAAFPSTLRQPYTYHWNLSIEEGIGANQAVTVGYLGAAAHSLLREQVISSGIPNISDVVYINNTGYSNYNALQLQFRRRSSRGLEILGSYTYAHSLDNVSADSVGAAPTILSTSAADYGPSDFDIRHTGSVAADYQIPSPEKSRLGKAVLGGWSVNTFVIARSAQPVNVSVLRTIGFGFLSYRPNLVPSVPLYLSNSSAPGGQVINVNAFSVPVAATQGDLGRNALRGFPLFQQDFSLSRSFHLRERLQLRARVEAFNIFNHPNFAPPASSLGFFVGKLIPLPSFGISQSMFATGVSSGAGGGAGFNPLYQVGGPRSLQLALKLEF